MLANILIVILPSDIFTELYETICLDGIEKYSIHKSIHCKFIATVKSELLEAYERFISGNNVVLEIHLQKLIELRDYLCQLKSNRTCLTCLLRMPEKVFSCGHSICETCIKSLGTRSKVERYTFIIERCFICGQAESDNKFRVIPPNAGIRILTLDGGGIRGIVSIMFLRSINQKLADFDCPLGEFFDLVCGTSAGNVVTQT
jgi:hypothetical protein